MSKLNPDMRIGKRIALLSRRMGFDRLSIGLFFIVVFFIVVFFVVVQTGCFLISLENMEIRSYPSERDQIIGAGEDLWAAFSIPPTETEPERMLTVRGGDEAVEGDFEWREGRLYFHAVPDLKPGVRYVLSMQGTLSAEDGRIFDIDHSVPFYADSAEYPAELLTHHPANGEAAELTDPLVFSFSRCMKQGSLENDIEINPHRDFKIEWGGDGKNALIIPVGGWEAQILYTWEIDESVTDGLGIPLQTSYTGSFIAGKDETVPVLLSMEPVGLFGSTYILQPGYGREDSLRFVFSTAMDFESLKTAFDIDPGLSGTFHQIDEESFVFDPYGILMMNTRYFVTIDTECASTSDINIASEIRRSFLPDIPAQELERIVFTGAAATTVLPAGFGSEIFPVISFSGAGPDFRGSVRICFAEAYDEPYRTRVAENITLNAYFPESVTNPEIVMKTWSPSQDEFTLFYSGFIKSEAAPSPERVLYKLSVPGGERLSMNQNGSFLEEDVWVIFQAEEE